MSLFWIAIIGIVVFDFLLFIIYTVFKNFWMSILMIPASFVTMWIVTGRWWIGLIVGILVMSASKIVIDKEEIIRKAEYIRNNPDACKMYEDDYK